ncbi:MAG: outer membrane protein assembly factor BamA [Candidatus Omnitrophica bacterium]|nr:outer membrane protein assembly factor BamA [Candidatus Omnitrophota bacterium]
MLGLNKVERLTFNKNLSIIVLMRYVLFLFIFLALFNPAFSQNSPGLVSSIEIRGNKMVGSDKIVTQIKTRINESYNENVINDDIKRIYALGYFEDIYVETREQEDNKVKVIFVVKEKPVLKKVTIEGSQKIREHVLKKKIDLKEGSFLEEMQLKEAQEVISDLYTKKGFPKTNVDYQILLDEETNEAEVVFNIYESGRLKIKKIFIRGNITFPDGRILKLMKTRPTWFLFRAGFFKATTFEDDLERIRDFYKKEGFQDVEVSYNTEVDQVRGFMYITVTIEEGRRYLIGEIKLEGFNNISERKIRDVMFLKSADIYSEEKVQNQLAKIHEVYFDEGYIFAQIKPLPFVNPDTGFVDITFNIKENNLVYIRMVDVRGNTKTKDKVIRRELRIKPDERFDGKSLRRSKENLQNLGFFESVNFDTEPTDRADYQDLVVEVKEAKTGTFSFGGGYSSINEFIGFVELRQRNFDVFNFPYFTGAGQDLSLYLQTGTTAAEYMLSFTEPWIFDKPISFGFDAYLRQHDRESDVGYGYNEKKRGGRLRLGKRFSDFLSAGANYTFETVTISDLSENATNALKQEEGENNISSVGLSLAYDRRDSVFNPTKGFIISSSLDVAGGGLGGDKDFIRVYSSFSNYFPLFRNSVLELKLRTGFAQAYDNSDEVPIYERFFAGGSSSIRGYHERKVGPIDPISEDPIGGEALFLGNLEYTYPLGDYLKLAAFYDTGNVWARYSDFLSGDLFSSIGLGIRVKTPLGPISVDYGWPLDLEPGEEKKEGRFHFNISRGF